MRRRTTKLLIIALSSVIAFGALYGANLWLVNRTVTKPLDRALRQVPGVTDVRVVEDSGKLLVDIKLGVVQDLKATYSQLSRQARDLSGRKKYEIVIEDKRDARLEEAYYQIHFDLQQAIATGCFSQMAEAIGRKAISLGLDRYRVFVDASNIYVQLHSGASYLYEIVPRPADEAASREGSLLSFGSFGLGG